MELDLETGDAERAEMSPAERRRIAREAAAEGKERSQQARASNKTTSARSQNARDKVEAELILRLDQAFDRIVKALMARGDEELASVINEDKGAMGQGLVSLTRNVKFLRGPLIFLLNVIEPVLAFGRVGRILYYRFMQRQERRAMEREQWQAEQQQQGEVVDGVVVAGT
jgi:hypothetical protein